MKRRSILRINTPTRPLIVKENVSNTNRYVNSTPLNSPQRNQDNPLEIENNTRERLQQNVNATEHIPGDIIIYNPGGFKINPIKTKRNIIQLDDLSKLSSKRISFLFIYADQVSDIIYLFRNAIPKLSWGSIIFTPKYKVGMVDIDNLWENFVLQNFINTYTSRQKFLDPHKKTKKEDYFAIKWLENPPQRKRSTKPLKIATVWRTGGTYTEDHVIAIYNACKKYVNEDFEFFCLTDYDGHIHDDVKKIPLMHRWKGYWSKMELFRPGLFTGSDVFYLDLDTLITHDITEIATLETDFFGMRDFNMLNELSSGVLKFNADKFNYIYRAFLANPAEWMKCKGGDQEAIRKILRITPDFMQDLFPRRMAEFKNHCWNEQTRKVHIPANYWIICFHSSPKMDDIQNDPHIKKYWLK